MKQILFILFIVFLGFSCSEDSQPPMNFSVLATYLDANFQLDKANAIACAGGTETTFLNNSDFPVGIFVYAEQGATDFKYFETTSVMVDKENFNEYLERELAIEDVFNGALKKFNRTATSIENWGIVTFKANGNLHISNPIRIKASISPTLDINDKIDITESGTAPQFNWATDTDSNNVIYFSVIADSDNNFISGTYTTDRFWTFYDTSNVVLNVTTNPNPTLDPNTTYNYTLMGVSEDNWVHTFGMKSFDTN